MSSVTYFIPPVQKSVVVATTPEKAFRLFTSNMHAWWPARHTLNAGVTRAAVVLEPQVGGRWYERSEDGKVCEWGKVLRWTPPSGLVLAWQIDGTWTYRPEFITEVEIRFVAVDSNSTRVELEHRYLERYAEARDQVRAALDSEGGWGAALSAFASTVSGQS